MLSEIVRRYQNQFNSRRKRSVSYRKCMNGGHYVRGIRGIAIISEVYSLLLDQFLIEIDENTKNHVVQQVKGISQLISQTNN